MMKAVVVKEFYSSLDQLHISAAPQPIPRPDDILIKVIAAGVNFVDTLYARGKHQNNRSLVRPPFTLGLEFSGAVVSAPPSSPFKPGDEVFGDASGSYAEYITIPPSSFSSLMRVPRGWSPTDAAGLGATLPVSHAALGLHGGLRPGQTVLVHAAAGGLGSMAVQLAVAAGCRVLATAGSRTKCEYAMRQLNAEICFDYTVETAWWKRVLEVTNGNGVDVVFDSVGLVDLSLKCIAQQGRILIVGFAGREGDMEKIAMNRVLLKQVSLIGYRYGETLRRDPRERARIWSEIMPLLEAGKIKPNISRTYQGLESVPQALLDMAERKISGKAVINVTSEHTEKANL